MDAAVALWFAGMERIPWLDALMAFITFLGDHGLVWIAVTLLLALFPRTRRIGLACALALILDVLVCNCLLKPLVARPRPFQALGLPLLIPPPGGYSFPSGHAASSFAAASVLARGFCGWPRYAAVGLAAAIGFSRVFLTVHYVTDVLAGALMGTLCGLAALWLTSRNRTKKV